MLTLPLWALALGAVKLALGLLAFLWLIRDRNRWHLRAESAEQEVATLKRDLAESDSLVFALQHRLAIHKARLLEIFQVITRRPPKRRWLAIARTVAKVTGIQDTQLERAVKP